MYFQLCKYVLYKIMVMVQEVSYSNNCILPSQCRLIFPVFTPIMCFSSMAIPISQRGTEA